MMPIQQEAIGLKRLQLYPLAGTPSTSAQAVPAPIVDRDTKFSTLFAWLQLTNQGMERPYDC